MKEIENSLRKGEETIEQALDRIAKDAEEANTEYQQAL
jgi:hypothetical protein